MQKKNSSVKPAEKPVLVKQETKVKAASEPYKVVDGRKVAIDPNGVQSLMVPASPTSPLPKTPVKNESNKKQN